MRNVLQNLVVLCLMCLCPCVYGMEEEYDESFERAWQVELNREIGVARQAYLGAYRDHNVVLMQRILELFSDTYHDNVKVLAACLKEWNDQRSVTVATAWYVIALSERDEDFNNQIYELVDDDAYRATLLTEVNTHLLQENAAAQNFSGVLTSSDFVDSVNLTYHADAYSGLSWAYDLSEGGLDKAWLLVQKS